MQDVVAFAYDDGALTARLTCEIDHHTARQIREKIDGVSESWELKTVWGVGYKFETKE